MSSAISRTSFAFVPAAAAVLAASLLAAPVSAQNGDLARSVPNLAVQGQAELSKPADELRLDVGVVTERAEAAEALQINARRMNEVIAAIEDAGLDDDEYETGRFQIQPVYTQRPRRQEGQWFPEIASYRVTNVVHIRTSQLNKAGEIIDRANEAGANSINGIQFTIGDPRKHRAEAIRVATRNAIADAEELANAAGLRLVRIVAINLDEQPPVRPMMRDMMAMERAVADAAPTPIAPGDVTVRATVNIVYEVAPRG